MQSEGKPPAGGDWRSWSRRTEGDSARNTSNATAKRQQPNEDSSRPAGATVSFLAPGMAAGGAHRLLIQSHPPLTLPCTPPPPGVHACERRRAASAHSPRPSLHSGEAGVVACMQRVPYPLYVLPDSRGLPGLTPSQATKMGQVQPIDDSGQTDGGGPAPAEGNGEEAKSPSVLVPPGRARPLRTRSQVLLLRPCFPTAISSTGARQAF